MRSTSQYIALVRHLGLPWVLFRARYAAGRRLGALRRGSPTGNWESVPAVAMRLADPSQIESRDIAGSVVQEADAVLQGRFRLFSHREVEAGVTPDWHRNQLTGETAPADRHWSELGDFTFGDIKGIWELNRFPWAFALTRAYVRTGEKRYADGFWRLFADWCARNPPNGGPNWMCGQEATFRLMAVVFAAEALGVPVAHRDLLGRFVVATGRRIAANLDYALSQKNNHGVSECVGLLTAALLVPDHSASPAWCRRGLQALESQLAELVYTDGGFSQHSLIYHRVLLHDLVWVKRRLELAGASLPAWLMASGCRATSFLLAVVDRRTGEAPLYGSNDGANILPLAEGGFLDFRPVGQLAAASFRRELPFPAGCWDEAAAWMVPQWQRLPRDLVDSRTPPVWHARDAGCWQATRRESRVFFRCPNRFRHRPCQADMLHVDIWYRGRRVATDAGSFSYNSQERFADLGSARLHNVLTVDGAEPVRKFSRFLYLPWPEGVVGADDGWRFCASHNGYARLGVTWKRTVELGANEEIVVVDSITGAKGRVLKWHWLLVDRPWKLSADQVGVSDEAGDYRVRWHCDRPLKTTLLRADPASAYGWWSPHYGTVEPACSLLIETESADEVRVHTEFSAHE